MHRIIPTHQLDQYIEVMLQTQFPFVNLYSLYNTDLLNDNSNDRNNGNSDNSSGHNTDMVQLIEGDHDVISQPTESVEIIPLKQETTNRIVPKSANQMEQSDLDEIRESEPYSTLQVIPNSQNSSESDIEQVNNHLLSEKIESDNLDKNIGQQGPPLHSNNNDDNTLNEQTEIHTVHLTKSNGQSLGLSVVGYIYKNPYDENQYNKGLFVQNIIPNSISDQCKSIQVNDQIIQVNETSLIGLDNVQAVSILKKANRDITLKLRRYLHGLLCEELKKAGSSAVNICCQQNLQLNTQQSYESDTNPDYPQSVKENLCKHCMLNIETSDSSDQSTSSKRYRERRPISIVTSFNQSDTLYMELTDDLIDSPCTCLNDNECIQKSSLMILSEGEENMQDVQLHKLLSTPTSSSLSSSSICTYNNSTFLDSAHSSDKSIADKFCTTYIPYEVKSNVILASFHHKIQTLATKPAVMINGITNKSDTNQDRVLTTDQEDETYDRIVCRSESDNNNVITSEINSLSPIDFSNEVQELETMPKLISENSAGTTDIGNVKQNAYQNGIKNIENTSVSLQEKVEITRHLVSATKERNLCDYLVNNIHTYPHFPYLLHFAISRQIF
ncbi:unnamed protein product [Heterobilharzia americana]|nr:unnamed protein product [Heterobilharzia americana]